MIAHCLLACVLCQSIVLLSSHSGVNRLLTATEGKMTLQQLQQAVVKQQQVRTHTTQQREEGAEQGRKEQKVEKGS